MELLAPVVAVTVHPRRARVTRRGRVEVAGGSAELVLAGLPSSLVEDSVRVTGRADGAVRIVGVDLAWRDLADAPDERVRAAEEAVRDAERTLAAVEGADAGDVAREELLQHLARRGGDRLAAALAEGTADAARVAEVGALVAAQLTEVAASRRATAERRTDARRVLDAATAELRRLQDSGRTRRDVRVGVEADAAGPVEVEVVYVVDGANWSSAYDARVGDGGVDDVGDAEITWYGLVTQTTGEDWPECELTLSTARPAVASTLPELDPWWVDVAAPAPPMPVMRAAAAPAGFAGAAAALEAAPVDPDGVSASWRLARPTAVPADGTPHRTTIATFRAAARLDHLTAPALSPEVHLRAVVPNTSGQVLLAGPVSTFLGDAYAGTTAIPTTAPGDDVELALGVDDRVVVERELVERRAHRARFGSRRGTVARWTITVANRRATPARVTVRDRVPVSRAAEVAVVDVVLTPEPTERDELGRLEWVAEIAPGATWTASVGFGVEHAQDVTITGYR